MRILAITVKEFAETARRIVGPDRPLLVRLDSAHDAQQSHHPPEPGR